MRFFLTIFIFFLASGVCLFSQDKNNPETFISHKVKKKETLYSISRLYNVSQEQIIEFNPMIVKKGLRKRMILKIPVYVKEENMLNQKSDDVTKLYIVKPKDTKWRIAYNFGITIQELESINPIIKEGLKVDQKIRTPISKEDGLSNIWDSNFNYYTVKSAEGYYRIEKKLGVTKKVLDSLNPKLTETGLLKGMVLKLPLEYTGDLRIEDDLLVEKISLIDSIKGESQINVSVMLPFRASEIEFDSIDDTRKILLERNLHTISTDFYSGIFLASKDLSKYGVTTKLSVYDTENKKSKIDKILDGIDLNSCQVIIGPLIPDNFDYISAKEEFYDIPKVAPLSTRDVVLRNSVYQSVTPREILRNKMFNYLNNNLDQDENIVIVADSLNRPIENRLKNMFPSAIILRPEINGYLLPELVDSLLVDSLPNKVILESDNFSLISSVSAQMSAQISDLREVQLFTTYHGNVYENENLSRKHLGDLGFTFTSGHFPLNKAEYNSFQERYIEVFGKPPNREAIRAYDLTLDLLLRLVYGGKLHGHVNQIGETEYQENRFWYKKSDADSFVNEAFYLLRHKGYDINEIKK
ncbi:MAG: LysM peptidoglycan-binding domain-containing protein [Bacteroidota bacterium]|nr:LysM peptidoglycan-binding domain-containing protein [Bacteroidota bacterium]